MELVVTGFPRQWTPHTVLLEGMFLIQTTPISGTSTFLEYCKLLVRRFLMPHLNASVYELHVIFDDPQQMPELPKVIEQKRRDNKQVKISHHQCIDIDDNAKVPSDWRGNIINCRTCKKKNYVNTLVKRFWI
jgi:hypothetical protein